MSNRKKLTRVKAPKLDQKHANKHYAKLQLDADGNKIPTFFSRRQLRALRQTRPLIDTIHIHDKGHQ